MEHKEPSIGFWIPVTDRPSAQYAAKMSGFPVFLMGLSFVLSGILQLMMSQTLIVSALGLASALLGGFLVFSGLQIRKLKFQTLPISILLWLVLNVVAIYFIGLGFGTILTVLFGILALSGLRGWYWLRKN